MIFKIKNFNGILLVILFAQLLGINSAYANSECYKMQEHLCKQRYWGGQGQNCYSSEQDWEEKYFNQEALLSYTISDIDIDLKYAKERQKRGKELRLHRDGLMNDDLSVCIIEERRVRFLALTTSNQASKSNKTSNSGASSNQSSSATTSSSSVPQSKQSYQAAQLAHNQANAGKGKKRNAQAEVPECLKPNANQTHYKNACNYAVNISYCFNSGNQSGISSAAKQLLADLNCNNEQFANTELSAGEELAGDYGDLTIAGMICKSPSQPLDMYFAAPEALGRCSF